MSNPNYQSGGAFLPASPARITSTDPWNFDVAPTVGTNTGQGSQTITTNTSTQTLTNKTISSSAVYGTASSVTATGATGANAAALSASSNWPLFVGVTGVSGAGLNLPTGVGGEWGILTNLTTGAVLIYAIASNINGVTGTTGVSLTITGNKTALFHCYAAGAWSVKFNT
jgi:hypothetical protein